MTDEGGTSCRRRCRFLGAKPGASRVEGAASVDRMSGLHHKEHLSSSKKEGEKFGNMQGIV